jgi:hypothetical protein
MLGLVKTTQMMNRIGCEVLTMVTIKSCVLWDVMVCSQLEVQQCVRAIHCLYLPPVLLFDPEDGGTTFLGKIGELL